MKNLVVALIVSAGLVSRPGYLGFGFNYHFDPNGGWLHVQRVAANGPAERAGLHPLDVITSINGQALRFKSDGEVLSSLGTIRASDRVTLTVLRAQTHLTITLVAAAMTDAQYERWKRNFDSASRRQIH
jgi:S1-C subfamily serine protease